MFLLNVVADWLLLYLTAVFRRRTVRLWRLTAAATVGAAYAFVVLLPPLPVAVLLPLKVALSATLILVAFGGRNPRTFLSDLGVFYLVSFMAGGAVYGLRFLLDSPVAVKNGALVTSGHPAMQWGWIVAGLAAIGWLARKGYGAIETGRLQAASRVIVTVWVDGKAVTCPGLVDTGNRLQDPLSGRPVLVVEADVLAPLFPDGCPPLVEGEAEDAWWERLPDAWKARVRPVFFRTLSGEGGILWTVRPDRVVIAQGDQAYHSTDILVGWRSAPLSSDGQFRAIVHPHLLRQSLARGGQPCSPESA
ncbi:sigma-E processing peptidase SpoIIGA [Calditerricola satsumensis]|uniref:Sporulation sigma-E factor-processing peptidase n=1 Tax=Calditerricola satsumensis TaxID=373054 RepID=A0A8J3B624_9BACI|nr:sporulation sigma-E factor-processing peptidase [Calditerricola satsumensis]